MLMPELQIKLSPTNKARQWLLLETIYWGNHSVPCGFITDLSSIPVGLRWFFPHGGAKAFSSVFHDWFYRNTIGTRKDADRFFRKLMLINGVTKWKAQLMYLGVRGGGWMSWAKSKRK